MAGVKGRPLTLERKAQRQRAEAAGFYMKAKGKASKGFKLLLLF